MQIAGLQPFTLSDFPGKSAAILFTLGCNMRCPFCHNHQLIKNKLDCLTEKQLFDFLKKRKTQLDGIVISGGEPTIHPDLVQFISAIKALNYAVKLDTNGTNPATIQTLIENKLLDFIAMDIKAPLSKYSLLCNTTIDTDNIQQSMKIISASNIPHLFRTTNVTHLLNEQDLSEIKQLVPKHSTHIVQKYIPVKFDPI